MHRFFSSLALAGFLALANVIPVGAYHLWGPQLGEFRATHLKVCFGDGVPSAVRTAVMYGINDWAESMYNHIIPPTNVGDCTGLNMGQDAYIRVKWDRDLTECFYLALTTAKEVGGADLNALWMDTQITKACYDDGVLDTTYPVADAKFDVFTIAAHEAGHALGLDHQDAFNDLMNTAIPYGQRRHTSLDDRDGVRATYGW